VCVCVCVTECDHEASIMRRPRPDWAVDPREKKVPVEIYLINTNVCGLYICFVKVRFNECKAHSMRIQGFYGTAVGVISRKLCGSV